MPVQLTMQLEENLKNLYLVLITEINFRWIIDKCGKGNPGDYMYNLGWGRTFDKTGYLAPIKEKGTHGCV